MGEREFGRDVPPRRVCFGCRRVYAGRQHWARKKLGLSKWRTNRPCSECGGPTTAISHTRTVPKRRDTRGWRRLLREATGMEPGS